VDDEVIVCDDDCRAVISACGLVRRGGRRLFQLALVVLH
jgi:hypothetical protein